MPYFIKSARWVPSRSMLTDRHNEAPESPFRMLTVVMLVHSATYRTNNNIHVIGS